MPIYILPSVTPINLTTNHKTGHTSQSAKSSERNPPPKARLQRTSPRTSGRQLSYLVVAAAAAPAVAITVLVFASILISLFPCHFLGVFLVPV